MTVLAAVVVATLAAGFLVFARLRPQVTVAEARVDLAVQAFYATGTVSPVDEYPVRCNADGILTEVRVTKGDPVKKGQVVAVVQDDELLLREKQAAAALVEAEKRFGPVLGEFDKRMSLTEELLVIARRELSRQEKLLEKNAATAADYDRALDRITELSREAAMLEAQRAAKDLELHKEKDVAEAALGIARWNLDQQRLKSPVDGVVLDRPTPVGTRVAVNDQVMMVADVLPGRLVMRAAVDEEDVNRVRDDPKNPQPVRMTLYAFPDRSFTGYVIRLYPKADPDRRTFEVDVSLPQPGTAGGDGEAIRFQAGMTGELAFEVRRRDAAVVVPSQALQGGRVYVVQDGRLVEADVRIGIKGVEWVEIESGLQAGDRVVVSPIGDLVPGKPVRVTEADAIATAALNKPKAREVGKFGF